MQLAEDQTDGEFADIYGDCIGEWCFPYDDVPINDMATAIARIYTPGGFVIAADGREAHTVTGRVRSDEEQKIFYLKHSSCSIACAVTGTARISSKQRIYRIGAELCLAANAIADHDVNNLGEYAELLGCQIQMSQAYQAIPAEDFSNAKPTTLLLDGFIAGQPMRAKATISHDQNKNTIGINSQDLFPGELMAFGSRIIYEALVRDPATIPNALMPYRKLCCEKSKNVSDAIGIAKAFIDAHCDDGVRLIIPDRCAGIGGRVHVATITPEGGFQWSTPPLNPML